MESNIKILHTWAIDIEKEVDDVQTEIRDGQSVQITRKVKKVTPVKMALKQPTRRELRQAELFYGAQVNWFMSHGFLPRSILVNKHLDLSGGVMSDKERGQITRLAQRHLDIEKDLIGIGDDEIKRKLQGELAGIRLEIANLNAANEAVFSQTAEVKAQQQLAQWFALTMTYIEKNGKWAPYFEGEGANSDETFKVKEEFMWKLEESDDAFYIKAIDKILTYAHFYNQGANTPAQFQLIDDEIKKMEEAKKAAETPQVTPEATPQVETAAPAAPAPA